MSKNQLRESRRVRRAQQRRNQRTIITIAGLVVVAVLAGMGYSIYQQQAEAKSASATATAQAEQFSQGAPSFEDAAAAAAGVSITTMASGLQIQDIVVGTGAEAKSGMNVSVHYTGWLADGTQFDSSLDRGQPFSFTLGTGGVIAGWDEGVAGMKVGGKRRLTIPGDLGYGAAGSAANHSTRRHVDLRCRTAGREVNR